MCYECSHTQHITLKRVGAIFLSYVMLCVGIIFFFFCFFFLLKQSSILKVKLNLPLIRNSLASVIADEGRTVCGKYSVVKPQDFLVLISHTLSCSINSLESLNSYCRRIPGKPQMIIITCTYTHIYKINYSILFICITI